MKRKLGSRLLGPLSIVAGSAALIALTWISTLSATHTQRIEAEARVSANVANQAQVFQDQLQRKLHGGGPGAAHPCPCVGDRPGALQPAGLARPACSAGRAWRRYFHCRRDRHRAAWHAAGRGRRQCRRSRLLPHPPGAIPTKTSCSSAPRNRTAHPAMAHGPGAPAAPPDGTFAGVIVASLPISALGNFYRMANIGSHGIIAVVGMDTGQVRMAVGPGPINRARISRTRPCTRRCRRSPTASGSADPPWMASSGSTASIAWPTAIWRSSWASTGRRQWRRPRNGMAAYVFAARITVLLLAMAGFLLHDLHGARRRELALAQIAPCSPPRIRS